MSTPLQSLIAEARELLREADAAEITASFVAKLDNKYERHMPARVEAEIAKDPESDYSTAVYRIVPPGVVKVTFSDPPGTERKWVQDPEYWYRGWALTFDKNQGSVGGAWLAGGSTYGRAKFTANRHQGLRHLIKLIDAEYPGQSKILS